MPSPEHIQARLPPRAALFFAAPFLVAGAFIVAIGGGWLHLPAESVQAPPWIILTCGVIFSCAGLLVLLESLRGSGNALGRALAGAMFCGLLLVLHWCAFGPGERRFTSSTSVGGVTVHEAPVSEGAGRAAFGTLAVTIDLIMIGSLAARWRRSRPTPDR